MRTTIRLPEPLLQRAKTYARERGMTLTSLIEQGLERILLGDETPVTSSRELPVCTAGGGLRAGLSLEQPSALLLELDRLEGRGIVRPDEGLFEGDP